MEKQTIESRLQVFRATSIKWGVDLDIRLELDEIIKDYKTEKVRILVLTEEAKILLKQLLRTLTREIK